MLKKTRVSNKQMSNDNILDSKPHTVDKPFQICFLRCIGFKVSENPLAQTFSVTAS